MEIVTITRATPADFDAAWGIVNEYYDAVNVLVRETPESFSAYYFGEGSGLWLARVNDSVAGCIALRPLASIPHAAEIKRMYVQPARRGLGLASRLLDAVHAYAKSFGYQSLYLDSKDDLPVAHAFYKRHGYTECERYNTNPQATIFMRRAL
jgi:GNAT superfamily N-acetyltransferase